MSISTPTAAMPGLWLALRDVVLFWVDQGVRIFRVDNPHTKPLPFWEWLIADIRGAPSRCDLPGGSLHPAEDDVPPGQARLLAVLHLLHLAQHQAGAHRLPHRADDAAGAATSSGRISSSTRRTSIRYFLQTSGRPGFLIRAALAATLSGLWGMYSGFELCEAAPLPGREEYLDSEKYEIRVRDCDAPGNIVAEITALNRIRRAHPALQTISALTLLSSLQRPGHALSASGMPAGGDMILVAVSLDPHHVQEADDRSAAVGMGACRTTALVDVDDLMRGTRFVWHGKHQRIRLDPADLPFAIWRIAPAGSAMMDVDAASPQADDRARDDPLWYKDAVIYQLHVKSFFDANNDGIGDFPGLIAKLDYIADLGVNTIWLLPFYPSPRLDDGYDISDYRDVHPDYGTLADVQPLHPTRRMRAACASSPNW